MITKQHSFQSFSQGNFSSIVLCISSGITNLPFFISSSASSIRRSISDIEITGGTFNPKESFKEDIILLTKSRWSVSGSCITKENN